MDHDAVGAEIAIAEERIRSCADDIRGQRWSSAAIALYFGLEHLVKALLATVGIQPKTHEGVRTMFSMHFIRPGTVPPVIGRYLGNLYERRTTAEYSPVSQSEFTQDEVKAYLGWFRESFDEIRNLLAQHRRLTMMETALAAAEHAFDAPE